MFFRPLLTHLSVYAFLVPMISIAQTPASKTESPAVCNELLLSTPKTPYGFAKATLVSLWYARNASERASEMTPEQADEATPVAILTAMLRALKNSTNDFICAKRVVQPFNIKSSDEGTRTAAAYLTMVYDQHIDLNNRALDLLKKVNSSNDPAIAVKFADEISTLQVARDQRWSDLTMPTTMALLQLVDSRPTDKDGNFLPDTKANREKGKNMRFAITAEQKQSLLDWVSEHFPELAKSPKTKLSAPASFAGIYVDFLNGGRKCSDE
jgi:hypothetical protein